MYFRGGRCGGIRGKGCKGGSVMGGEGARLEARTWLAYVCVHSVNYLGTHPCYTTHSCTVHSWNEKTFKTERSRSVALLSGAIARAIQCPTLLVHFLVLNWACSALIETNYSQVWLTDPRCAFWINNFIFNYTFPVPLFSHLNLLNLYTKY